MYIPRFQGFYLSGKDPCELQEFHVSQTYLANKVLGRWCILPETSLEHCNFSRKKTMTDFRNPSWSHSPVGEESRRTTKSLLNILITIQLDLGTKLPLFVVGCVFCSSFVLSWAFLLSFETFCFSYISWASSKLQAMAPWTILGFNGRSPVTWVPNL